MKEFGRKATRLCLDLLGHLRLVEPGGALPVSNGRYETMKKDLSWPIQHSIMLLELLVEFLFAFASGSTRS
jgi:hypothetical protein